MKRMLSFVLSLLMLCFASVPVNSQGSKKEVYELAADKRIKLIVEDGTYKFSGSGEEYDWIVDHFGQQGEWELKEYFKGPDYTVYIRQDGVVVNKRENSLDLQANIARDCVVTFIKAK